jgi:putative ABC transport system substrate-binding protein
MGITRDRQFLIAVRGLLAACAVLTAPLGTAQTGKIHRVAYLHSEGAESKEYEETFRSAMRDLGYLEGRNLILDVRAADLDMTKAAALVDELIALKPDVLVGWESSAQVMHAKTTSIPIVIYGAIDPVKAGLAKSLRRPGKNVTGVAQLNDQLPAKHIEVMREILPRLARVGQFVDETSTGCKIIEESARQAARRFGVALVSYSVSNGKDIEQAFAQMEQQPPDVLLPCPSAVMFNHRDLLFQNATRLRIPFTSFVVANVPQGVLFAYAASMHDTRRRAAIYVDKVLKGAKPGELPIEQPTNFELVVNLKTAKALNLTIPQSILLRADRVIE